MIARHPSLPPGLPPWRIVNYDLHSKGLADGAETFFSISVEPTCIALAAQLASIPCGPTNEEFDRWDDLRDSQLELHRSFALALGGMWERHFRQHLSHSVIVLCPGKGNKDVEDAHWPDLLKLFQKARGFPLSAFPCFKELELLHRVSSAVRHGNGPSTESLFETNPELFGHEPVTDFLKYMTWGGEPDHSIHKLEITLDRLASFKNAVVEFWLTIDVLRMSSPYP